MLSSPELPPALSSMSLVGLSHTELFERVLLLEVAKLMPLTELLLAELFERTLLLLEEKR